MPERKVTDDELNQIKKLQTGYAERTLSLGDLRVQRILLQQQWDRLDQREKQLVDEFVELQNQEQQIVSELTTKYGPGNISMSDGTFVKS